MTNTTKDGTQNGGVHNPLPLINSRPEQSVFVTGRREKELAAAVKEITLLGRSCSSMEVSPKCERVRYG